MIDITITIFGDPQVGIPHSYWRIDDLPFDPSDPHEARMISLFKERLAKAFEIIADDDRYSILSSHELGHAYQTGPEIDLSRIRSILDEPPNLREYSVYYGYRRPFGDTWYYFGQIIGQGVTKAALKRLKDAAKADFCHALYWQEPRALLSAPVQVVE